MQNYEKRIIVIVLLRKSVFMMIINNTNKFTHIKQNINMMITITNNLFVI